MDQREIISKFIDDTKMKITHISLNHFIMIDIA